jgi:hypothetical protein
MSFDGPLPHISDADLVANPRGLAYAAFGKPEGIALLLGCDLGTAQRVKDQARARFEALQVRIAQARRGRPS